MINTNLISEIIDNIEKITEGTRTLKVSLFNTQLKPMIAISSDTCLYLLEFLDRKNLKANIFKLKKQVNAIIIEGKTKLIASIESEIDSYFKGELKEFKTPTCFIGTEFQKLVWESLIKIPFGETRSYKDIAVSLDRPKSFRAVARANSTNKIIIAVPCHRVINTDGGLGGYSAGIEKKRELLSHESYNFKKNN